MRVASVLAAAVSAALLAGCGVFYQGTTQQLTVDSVPPGAQFAFSHQTGVTPSTLTLKRRHLDWTVYRVAEAGYQPSCAIVYCGTPRWIRIADSIPLAIPLLIDVAAGTLFNCEQPPTLVLRPLPPGGVAYQLPSDQAVMESLRRTRFDLCVEPYLYDDAFGEVADRIGVTEGRPEGSYVELGPVSIGRVDTTVITTPTAPVDQGFAPAGAQKLFNLASAEELNAMLRRRALYEYGTAADEIVDVVYQTNPRADVYASGTVVQYAAPPAEPAAPAPGSAAERLQTLRDLFQRGDITEAEYDRKREEILRGL